MMKHTGSVALGLGLVFGVPALTFGGGLPDSLGEALDETLRAMQVLGQLREDLDGGKTLPPHIVENVTEAPLGEARQRDERLALLREDVAKLQSQVDLRRMAAGFDGQPGEVALPSAVDSGASGTDSVPVMPVVPRATAGSDTTTPAVGSAGTISSGLSEEFVQSIGSGSYGPQPAPLSGTEGPLDVTSGGAGPELVPATGDATTDGSTTEANGAAPKLGPEGKGYSAHPLRQARACFRAGRFQQGADILAAATPSTEGDYWQARCLEKLDRLDEAITLLKSVELAEDAGDLAARATSDREFAEWRRSFIERAGLEEDTVGETGKGTSK